MEKPKGNLGAALMVFHKSFHKMLGFFNTEYSKFYSMEDGDMGFRARIAGFKLGYLKDPGVHLGVGNEDTGEYRVFKTREHNNSFPLFQANVTKYLQGKKPIYLPCKI
jgi:GT2 family glycosyltransferase